MTAWSGVKSVLRRTLPIRVIEAIRAVRRPKDTYRVLKLKHRFTELNRGLATTQVRLRPGLTFKVEPTARPGFEAYCWSWPEMVDELDCFLALSESKTAFVDVGALHGIFCLAFAHGRHDRTVLAVEPGSEGCKVLTAHLASNEVTNVAVEQRAVGAGHGTITMASHGLLLEVVPTNTDLPGLHELVDVPLSTVDELCHQRSIHPDLLKVDVEGYELHVLKGCERVLRQDRPDILLELHPNEMRKFGSSALELVSFLADLGYRFRNLRGRAISPDRVEEIASRWGHLVCTIAPEHPG